MAATAWMPTVGRGTGRTLLCSAQDAPRSLVAPEAQPPGRKVAVPPGPGSAQRAKGRGARAEWRPRGFSPSFSPGRRREGAVGSVTRAGRAGPGRAGGGAPRHPSERPAERSRRRGHSSGGTPRLRAAPGARVAESTAWKRHSREELAVPGTAEPAGENCYCRAGGFLAPTPVLWDLQL